MTRRVLIVDDHEVLRDGVRKLLDEQPGAISCGEAGTPDEALRMASTQEWDAVVLDLSLAGRSGLDVLKQLKMIRPRLPILVLTIHSEEQYARRAFKAGAAGFITKDSPRAELSKAILKVLDGGKYLSPALAEKLIVDLERGVDRTPDQTLSDREFQVMRLIASGKTLSEIADLLSLSDKTISTYRARLMEKMGMRTNAELTRYAILNKLVD
ncbi:MAG: response regulator transcription factor [Bryobacteraceae bacterium]|jgi:DNA-binding NarL/FixJ family response regulator